MSEHDEKHCTVHCDADGCSARIYTNRDITEEQAAEMATAAGWESTKGTARWHHHCRRHKTQ